MTGWNDCLACVSSGFYPQLTYMHTYLWLFSDSASLHHEQVTSPPVTTDKERPRHRRRTVSTVHDILQSLGFTQETQDNPQEGRWTGPVLFHSVAATNNINTPTRTEHDDSEAALPLCSDTNSDSTCQHF